jgi:hypothetical protein
MNKILLTLSVTCLLMGCAKEPAENAQDTSVLPGLHDKSSLPTLDGKSAEGLRIECSPAKRTFLVNDPVKISCKLVNTTDRVMPVGWHKTSGDHFCLVQGEEVRTREGRLPLALPQNQITSFVTKAKSIGPGEILYLPPHESIVFLLTYPANQPEEFKGCVVYDPLSPRAGFSITQGNTGQPLRDEWAISNSFKYAVIAANQ